MLTDSAASARAISSLVELGGVASRRQLRELGFDAHAIDAQVAANRWQRVGPAVLLHSGPPTIWQRRRVCLISCGPRSALTSFTAAQEWGLKGWERRETHVLLPAGAARPPSRNLLLRGLVIHRVREWSTAEVARPRGLHTLAPALLRAAASFPEPRPGCALFAAAIQQRLIRPEQLRRALSTAPKVRHRRALTLAIGDIEQGAEALSEIDFARLCRRFGLPAPTRQGVRVERDGRRRYLDVEWRLADGLVVCVEVDGAYHLEARQWIADQLRQNRIVIGGTIVLRYPSIVVREQPELVGAELAEVLKR